VESPQTRAFCVSGNGWSLSPVLVLSAFLPRLAFRRRGVFLFGPAMDVRHYRKLIVDAVRSSDKVMLDKIANQLADCESAWQILCSNGYGGSEVGIVETVREVLLDKQ
jgi:hypothetical protein